METQKGYLWYSFYLLLFQFLMYSIEERSAADYYIISTCYFFAYLLRLGIGVKMVSIGNSIILRTLTLPPDINVEYS